MVDDISETVDAEHNNMVDDISETVDAEQGKPGLRSAENYDVCGLCCFFEGMKI